MKAASVKNIDTIEHLTPIQQLSELLQEEMSAVNKAIINRIGSSVPLIPQLAQHIISAGGKRIRPLLTLAFANLMNYHGRRHIPLAASIEFIHTATLLHDDVIDESDLRRNKPSANALWDNKACILVGDFLFGRSFELMTDDGNIDVLKVLSNVASTIIEGEVLQLITMNDISTSEEKYFEIIKSKTAKLFSAACEIGAVVADASDIQRQAITDYGRFFGISFQLIDDLLDYSANSAELGKSIGDDFKEGKITLPVILAYHHSNEEEKEFWVRTINNVDQNDLDFPRAIAIMKKYKVFETVKLRAYDFADKASQALDIFADSPMKTCLQESSYYCVNRIN